MVLAPSKLLMMVGLIAMVMSGLVSAKPCTTLADQLARLDQTGKISLVDGTPIIPIGMYIRALSEDVKWKKFSEFIQETRNKEAPKLNAKRNFNRESNIAAPAYGYARNKTVRFDMAGKTIDEAYEKFNKGRPFKLENDGGKIIITPQDKVIGQQYIEIRYDPSGNYFRLQKGIYAGKKQLKFESVGTQFVDWNGEVVPVIGHLPPPEFHRLMNLTHFNAIVDTRKYPQLANELQLIKKEKDAGASIQSTTGKIRKLYKTAGDDYAQVTEVMLNDIRSQSREFKNLLAQTNDLETRTFDYVFVGAGIHTGISKGSMANELGDAFNKTRMLTIESTHDVSVFGRLGKSFSGNTQEHIELGKKILSQEESLNASRNFQAGSGIQVSDVAKQPIPVADQFLVPAVSNHWIYGGNYLFESPVTNIRKVGELYEIEVNGGQKVFSKNIVMGTGLGQARLPTKDLKSLEFIKSQQGRPDKKVFFVEDLLEQINNKQEGGLSFMEQFANKKAIIVGGGHGGAIGIEAIEGLGPQMLYQRTGGLNKSKTPSSYLWVNLEANTGDEFKKVIGGGERYHKLAPLLDAGKIKSNPYYLHEVLPGDGGIGIKVSFLDKKTNLPLTDAAGNILYEKGDFLVYATGYESQNSKILSSFAQQGDVSFRPLIQPITPNDVRVVHDVPVTVGNQVISQTGPENIFIVGPSAGKIPHPNDPGGLTSVTINVFGARSEALGKFLAREALKKK